MRFTIAIVTVFLLSITAVHAQDDIAKLTAVAEEFVKNYNSKNYEAISSTLGPEAAKQLTPALLKQAFDAQHKRLGKITSLGKGELVNSSTAVFPLTLEKGNIDLAISLNESGQTAGIQFLPPKPKTFEVNSVAMRLPFEGEWFVVWGGDTREQNYHQDFPNQRFAFDFLKVDKDGKTHSGYGKRNEDYYAFGQRIVAPAAGIVTDVVDGVRDNVPGIMNPLMALGNNVVIKHAEGEYSAFAHFQQNSIVVKVGQKVTKGEFLGLSGNSGNSSEAHLHFQVQKGPLFENEGSKKVFFGNLYIRTENRWTGRKKLSPVKGNRIRQLVPAKIGISK